MYKSTNYINKDYNDLSKMLLVYCMCVCDCKKKYEENVKIVTVSHG